MRYRDFYICVALKLKVMEFIIAYVYFNINGHFLYNKKNKEKSRSVQLYYRLKGDNFKVTKILMK